jgi:hypothetical protein
MLSTSIPRQSLSLTPPMSPEYAATLPQVPAPSPQSPRPQSPLPIIRVPLHLVLSPALLRPRMVSKRVSPLAHALILFRRIVP